MDPRHHSLATSEAPTERPSRILVIDDDRYIRMLLCDLLATWGYEADAAAGGVEGLALFERGGYDAVLTDFRMPNLSGLDVAAGVRDRDPSVAVILFTAFHGDLEGENGRASFTVLRKPLDIDVLHRALRTTLAETPATP